MTDDEQGWIERSLQGDHEAFEALVRRYQRMIYSLAYRMTGSAADAEDMTQETFIRAHQQLSSFRAEAKFSSWLYRIAVNHCLNWRQWEIRRGQIHTQWAESKVALQSDAASTSDNDELGSTVQAALMKLPVKQRAALVLTTYDGLSHAEAARALGCSETTVSWRIFASRGKLRRLLKDARTGGEPYE